MKELYDLTMFNDAFQFSKKNKFLIWIDGIVEGGWLIGWWLLMEFGLHSLHQNFQDFGVSSVEVGLLMEVRWWVFLKKACKFMYKSS